MSPEVLNLSQIRDSNPAYKGISDEGLFNHLHSKYYSDIPRTVLAKEIGYELPDKPFSDDLGQFVHQAAGGVNDFNKMVGEAAQVWSPEDSGVHDWAKGVEERATAREPEYAYDEGGRGLLAQIAHKGVRSLAPSAAIAAAGAVGGLPAAALGTVGLFGASQYKETYDKVKEAGGSDEDAHLAGLETGAINSAGEFAESLLSLKALGLGKKAIQGTIEKALGTATDSSFIKPWAKATGQAMLGESITEPAQNLSTEAIERGYNAGSGESYTDIAKNSVEAAVGMSGMFGILGLHGHYKNSKQAEAIDSVLANPDSANPDERMAVVDILHQDAKKNGISDADAWLVGAKNDVKNGAPIRRTSATTISDIGSADTVDDAITAASGVVNGQENEPVLDIPTTDIPYVENRVDSKIPTGTDVQSAIDSQYADTGYVPESIRAKRGFGLQSELADLAAVESKDKASSVQGLLAGQELQRDKEAQSNAAINNPSLAVKSGFGQLSEFSQFADELANEKATAVDDLLGKQALRRESNLETLNNTLDEQRKQQTQAKRLAILNSVLDDDTVENKQAKFEAEIKRNGYNDTKLTPFELSHLKTHIEGFLTKDEALDQSRISASPNEQDFYEPPKAKSESQLSTEPTKVTEPATITTGTLPDAEPSNAVINKNTNKPYFPTLTAANKVLTGDKYPETSDTHEVVKVGKLFQVVPKIEKQNNAETNEIAGDKINHEWTKFSNESGSLGIPRAEMPQVKAEHRGALVNFLNARGISHESVDIPASELKPTQLEFSPGKVDRAKKHEGGDRSILISSDNHVIDGHHQWLAKLDERKNIKAIKLNAKIKTILKDIHEFPSSDTSNGVTTPTQESELLGTDNTHDTTDKPNNNNSPTTNSVGEAKSTQEHESQDESNKNEPVIPEADMAQFMEETLLEDGVFIAEKLSKIRSQIDAFEKFKNCVGGK